MSLSNLPTELLIDIATHLDAAGMNALARTNTNAYNLLNDSLCCRDLTQSRSSSLTWAAKNGVEGTIQRAIDVVAAVVAAAAVAAQNIKPTHMPKSFLIVLEVATKRGHFFFIKPLPLP